MGFLPRVKILVIVFMSFLLFCGCNNAEEASDEAYVEQTEVPTEEPTESPQEKAEKYDKENLEQGINEVIEGRAGDWSVYVGIPKTDFKLEINSCPMRSASVIKLYNMVAFYKGIADETFVPDELMYKCLENMITVSSNTDSNAVVKALGAGEFYAGAKVVTDMAQEMGCVDTKEQSPLYDISGYGAGINQTSVRDCGSILTKLYEGKCVSPKYDEEMIELLKRQQRDWKIPQGLPEGTIVANKTGENSRVEWDVALVYSPECDYVICIAVKDFGNANVYTGFWEISKTVYEFFNGDAISSETENPS